MLFNTKYFLATFIMLFANFSFAYIDPGTGANLIQALVALIAGVTFAISRPIELIKSLIKKIMRR